MRKDLCWQLLWIPALKAGRSLEGFRIDSHISKGAVLKPCYQKDMFFLRTKEFKKSPVYQVPGPDIETTD